jgi:PfaB family protein
VLVASSNKELKREVQYFLSNLVAKPQATLQTPAGSYYTPKQLGNTGKLALVYPGSGSPYVGAGAMLFQAFPGLYDMLQKQGFDMTNALSSNLYPRHLFALDSDGKQEVERRLQTNALAMILAGGAFSGLYTELLQEYLGVQADSVLGYSQGEASTMYYCQSIWKATAIEEKFVKAPLFREKVGGRMTLLADLWQLPEAEAAGTVEFPINSPAQRDAWLCDIS